MYTYFKELKAQTKLVINEAIKEDYAKEDITSLIVFPGNNKITCKIIAKETGILAGIDIAKEVFKTIDSSVIFRTYYKDGDKISQGKILAKVTGRVRSVFAGERIALNFLQHLSGIATLTNLYTTRLSSLKTKLLDTRKTLPGWRYLEKYAVSLGSGNNHRMNLKDMILVKDNHIKASGSVSKILSLVYLKKYQNIKVEVEVETIEELKECLNFPVDIIMLDNMNIRILKKAIKLINKRCKIEVSGGININNIYKIAKCGVDYISVGKITSSAPALDIHMEL